MFSGVDAATPLTNYAGCLKRGGYQFAGRYLNGVDKRLYLDEADHLASQGLKLVAIFEENPTYAGYFSRQRGINDGALALRYASELGMESGKPIFFTVDMDALPDDLDAIKHYYEGIRSVLQPASGILYLCGVYGSGLVCSTIKGAGLAHVSWLAESRGWAGTKDYSDWDLLQLTSRTICLVSVDTNKAKDDSCFWTPSS